MFEAAELGVEVDKETWEKESPRVRDALLQAQRDLAGSKFSCEGAGKREVVNFLLEWMDARGVQTACEMFEKAVTGALEKAFAR